MQSATHCRTRDQYVEREINAAEKPQHYGSKEVDDRGQASGQTNAFHQCGIWGKKKRSDQSQPTNEMALFFPLRVVNIRTWP